MECDEIWARSQRRVLGSFCGKRKETVRRVSDRRGGGRRGVVKLGGSNEVHNIVSLVHVTLTTGVS